MEETSTAHRSCPRQDEVAENLKKELASIQTKAQTLCDTVMTNKDLKNNLPQNINDHIESANFLSHEMLQLKDLALQKAQDVSDYNSQNGLTLDSVLSSSPWDYIIGGTNVVTTLSDVYSALDANVARRSKNISWVPPSNFERSTHKYWVEPSCISNVMMKCVSEVPILIYGKESAMTTGHNYSDIWNHVSTNITSIYFDSQKSMTLYKDRIARLQGAQLFRIRWYGDKPSPDGILFLELKTHHEEWVQNKSVKERVALRAKDISHILVQSNTDKHTSSPSWTKDKAKELVLAAKPELDDDELKTATDLLLRIQHLVIKKNLRPCVRSTYRRVAFQSSSNNDLRFTLDRDIQLSSEIDAPPLSWCLDNKRLSRVASVKIPVPVFEVKLNGVDAPDWLEKLLNESRIYDGHKFSKYLTGASVLFPQCVASFPYWALNPLFQELYRGELDESQHAVLVGRNATVAAELVDLRDSAAPNNSSNSITEDKLTPDLPEQTRYREWFTFVRRKDERKALLPTEVHNKQKIRIEPKTYFAAERTFIQWISVSLLLVTMSALLFTLSSENYNAPVPRFSAVILMCTAIFVSTYALAIYFRRLYLLQNGKQYGYIDHFAPVVLTMAALAGISCMFYYYTIGAGNHAPETNFTMFVQEDECYRIDYTGVSKFSFEPSDIAIDRNENLAYVPSGPDITVVDLTSSNDVFNGNKKHSVHVVASVPRADLESVVWMEDTDTLFTLSEQDAMLYAFRPNEIDASRPDTPKSMKMAGRWKLDEALESEGMAYRSDDGKLYVSTVEGGINVFDVPAVTDIDDSFFFDASEDPNVVKLYPVFKLNKKLLLTGLEYRKDAGVSKIGAMQVFEDILYILFDNARVIRGFDFASASMVSEVALPRVSSTGEFDKQWEGIFFERRSMMETEIEGSSSAGLRGSTTNYIPTVVQLHMALDTPPEIWTFTMKESKASASDNNNASSFEFPACAATY